MSYGHAQSVMDSMRRLRPDLSQAVREVAVIAATREIHVLPAQDEGQPVLPAPTDPPSA